MTLDFSRLEAAIGPLGGAILRYAEDQERSVTRPLVDTLAEHDLLESILDESKPPYHPDSAHLDYLLKTPFRYPPLRHGSRFGGVHEAGIFYGAETLKAIQYEIAFYRFSFYFDMETPPSSIQTEHILFRCHYSSDRALNLAAIEDDHLQQLARDPLHYQPTQAIGTWARTLELQSIRYLSARTPDHQCNVAVLDPKALKPKREHLFNFTVFVQADRLSLTAGREGDGEFDRDIFPEELLVNGVYPRPAA